MYRTPPPSPARGGIHLHRFAMEERVAAPPRAGELSAKPTEGAFSPSPMGGYCDRRNPSASRGIANRRM